MVSREKNFHGYPGASFLWESKFVQVLFEKGKENSTYTGMSLSPQKNSGYTCRFMWSIFKKMVGKEPNTGSMWKFCKKDIDNEDEPTFFRSCVLGNARKDWQQLIAKRYSPKLNCSKS